MERDDYVDEFSEDPNGPAYQKKEERTGPPLDYVSEKLRFCIESLHETIRSIKKAIRETGSSEPSAKADILLVPAWSSFRYAVTAFFALHNILALANDQGIFDRLLDYSREDFHDWLTNLEKEGLVSG